MWNLPVLVSFSLPVTLSSSAIVEECNMVASVSSVLVSSWSLVMTAFLIVRLSGCKFQNNAKCYKSSLFMVNSLLMVRTPLESGYLSKPKKSSLLDFPFSETALIYCQPVGAHLKSVCVRGSWLWQIPVLQVTQ